jgi:urease accessory protein
MNKHASFSLVILSFCLLFSATASAHPNGNATLGFQAGLAHPFSGLDHVLAMVAIGLWAVQRGGRALWQVPGAFLSCMMAGGLLATTGIQVPYAESGVLLSVMVFGVLIAAAYRWPLAVCAGIAAVFALCHGNVHVLELAPAAGTGAPYIAGIILGTALLHAMGMIAGILLRTLHIETAVRVTGLALAMGGIALGLVS